jgi:hypothetical protein
LPFGFGPKGEENASMCFLMVFGVTVQSNDESPMQEPKNDGSTKEEEKKEKEEDIGRNNELGEIGKSSRKSWLGREASRSKSPCCIFKKRVLRNEPQQIFS